jgi:hypothetical protein
VSVAAFIGSQRTEHSVPHTVTCRALGLSESWFYKWRNRPPHASTGASGRAGRQDSGDLRRVGRHLRLAAGDVGPVGRRGSPVPGTRTERHAGSPGTDPAGLRRRRTPTAPPPRRYQSQRHGEQPLLHSNEPPGPVTQRDYTLDPDRLPSRRQGQKLTQLSEEPVWRSLSLRRRETEVGCDVSLQSNARNLWMNVGRDTLPTSPSPGIEVGPRVNAGRGGYARAYGSHRH